MKNITHPIRSTVIFALLCGLLFVPLSIVLSPVVDWPPVLFLPIWLFVALYSGLMTRWTPVGIKAIIYPLIVDTGGNSLGGFVYALYDTHNGNAELDSEWYLFYNQRG